MNSENGSRQFAGRSRPSPFTAVEYFAGIGLFRMGLESAGWKVVYSNDWNPDRERIYHGFFSEHYAVKDIFSVEHESVPPAMLATCSFPCVDLSLAGKLCGINGEQSGAFWGFYDILKKQGATAPPIVLLENVAGWLSSNGGEDFHVVLKSLNILGYSCDVFALNARSFVPQSRPRIFLAGVRMPPNINGYGLLQARSELLAPAKLRDIARANAGLRWLDLNPPAPPPHKSAGLAEFVVQMLPSDDSRWWPDEKVEKHLSMMSPAHLLVVKGLSGKNKMSYKTFFRRRRTEGQRAEVRPDDIAGCLRTATGGSGKQFLVVAGRGTISMRTLTAREYARLQGVPDKFSIAARTERQALNAFGDAVCVPAVEWIAHNVLTPLARKICASRAEA